MLYFLTCRLVTLALTQKYIPDLVTVEGIIPKQLPKAMASSPMD